MEFNLVSTGISLVGVTVSSLKIENGIVDIEKESKKIFGMNINEPHLEKGEDNWWSQISIDFNVEIEQAEGENCKIEMTLEGAFIVSTDIDEEECKKLVGINGASALIGVARGKIETITASIFNNGKIVIPFINVIDYYKSVRSSEEH